QSVLALRREQSAQRGIAAGKKSQQLRRRSAEVELFEECPPQWKFAAGNFHDFPTVTAERLQNVADEFGAIRRLDADRVADFVVYARAFERNFKMPRLFLRTFSIQAAICQQARGKWTVVIGDRARLAS